MDPTAQSEMKAALKDAIKEWMDAKFADLGRWTLHGVLVAAIGALAYFILTTHGWKPPVDVAIPGLHR